jgi:hypothetical protein
MQDADIIRILREEGISPLEINDSLNQAKVKAAVSAQEEQSPQFSEMDRSIMSQEDVSNSAQEEAPAQVESYSQPQYDQSYSGQSYYQPAGLDTETISEIAEQIVIEKFEDFSRRVGDLVSFRLDINDKIKDIEERIKRLEASLDKVQQAVIGKIGEYGDNLSLIKRDMSSIHDTMSKLMNPLIDNFMEMKKLNERSQG